MRISGITWSGPPVDDAALLGTLPDALATLLAAQNGFIVHNGALHVRGVCDVPPWHSLRRAWKGAGGFAALYEEVQPTDVPFAEDMLGDQFLLRGQRVMRLVAETGEVEEMSASLGSFFASVEEDIVTFLNVSLQRELEPGMLLFAYPPFCLNTKDGHQMKPCPSDQVIAFHADFARQIRSVGDGESVQIEWTP